MLAYAADGAGGLGLGEVGASECGETKGQRFQVVARRVAWFSILLDGAEKLAHGAVESIREPGPLKDGSGHPRRRRHGIRLPAEIGPGAHDRAVRSGDDGRVLGAETGEPIENQRRLRSFEFDKRLTKQRRLRPLSTGDRD